MDLDTKAKLMNIDKELAECRDKIKEHNKNNDFDKLEEEIKHLNEIIEKRNKIKPLTFTERAQIKMLNGLTGLFMNRGKK